MIHTARNVNDSQPHFVVDLVRRALGNDLTGKRIAALGLAYTPDVDDLRESPAVAVAEQLAQAGAQVVACEPHQPGAHIPDVTVTGSLPEALAWYSLVRS